MKYFFISFLLFKSFLFGDIENDMINNLNNNKLNDAKTLIENNSDIFNSSGELLFLASKTFYLLDDLDLSNKYILDAINKDNSNKDYRLFKDSLDDLKKSIKSARKTFDSGLSEQAIMEFKQICEKYPESGLVFYELGFVYKNLYNFSDAYINYNIARNNNSHNEKYTKAINNLSQILTIEGDKLHRIKEYDSALNKYLEAVEYSPEYGDPYFRIAKLNYAMKRYDNAKEWAEKTLLIKEDDFQALKMIGDIYMKWGEVDNAIINYNNSIQINDKYERVYYSLALAYKSENKTNDAIYNLNKAIVIDSTYSKAYETLGVIYQEEEKYSKAIENFTLSIANNQKSYQSLYRLSTVYNIIENFNKAKESAKKCLSIKRNYAPAYCELGISEIGNCNRIAAEDAFNKAKKDRNYRKFASDYLKNINYYMKDCN